MPTNPGDLSGWSSCGCEMDIIRSCYSSFMRPFKDHPEILIPGRWHFCPPGAETVPYFHAFASSNWDPDGVEYDGLLGEVVGEKPWYRGSRSPRVTGTHWCGSRELWENGSPLSLRGSMPVDIDGLPLACSLGSFELLTLNAGGAGGAGLIVPIELRAGGTGGARDVYAAGDLATGSTLDGSTASPTGTADLATGSALDGSTGSLTGTADLATGSALDGSLPDPPLTGDTATGSALDGSTGSLTGTADLMTGSTLDGSTGSLTGAADLATGSALDGSTNTILGSLATGSDLAGELP